MRILLIQPPYFLQTSDERQAMPPLGLAYIAATLAQAGYEVHILDGVVEAFERLTPLPDGRFRHGLTADEIARRIQDLAPRIVGVSCLFSAQADSAHEVCRIAKQVVPDVLTIMGGAHPSATPHEVLADSAVDVVAIGEGERSMLRVVQAVERNAFPPVPADGLAFRVDGRVEVAPRVAVAEEMDRLPRPARHLLPMQKYLQYRAPHGGVVKRHPVTNLITSRGCPAQCNFCSIHNIWGRRFRYHSAEYVVGEIEHLVREYGVRELQFEDDNLTLRRERAAEICRAMIERRLDVTWSTPNGVAVYALDAELLGLMRDAGCHHITLGIESGSEHTLKRIIRKPVRLERIQPIVEACRRLGIGVSAFFVVGFPGETRSAIEQTLDLACTLDIDTANIFLATPYPGTALFEQCVREGLMRTPVDYRRIRIGQPLIDTAEWSGDEVAAMVAQAQARFYRRAACRRPLRFFGTVLGKFAREPRYVMRKAYETMFPGGRAATMSTVEEADSNGPAGRRPPLSGN